MGASSENPEISNVNTGLTSQQAEELLQKHGPNKLPEKPPPTKFKIFLSQFKSPLVYVLLGAALVTAGLGHFEDTVIILIAVAINTILGYIQEYKAGETLQALKELIHPQARVLRDGDPKIINVEDIVPGDVVIVHQGEKVPADGKVLQANRLYMSEAVLTGESVAVAKNENDPMFMGTVVSSGKGVFLVEKTGANTEVGGIAESVQEPNEETPLRKQLSAFSKKLSIIVLVLVTLVFVVGTVMRYTPGGSPYDVAELFGISVALAVSAIPEGLLVSLTVVLAIGMQRILKRKGLVRNLASAETLGGVTTICTDKTGTLTQGKMQVVTFQGDENILAMQVLLANDMDDPLEIAAHEWGNSILKDTDDLATKYPQLDSIAFSSEERVLVSLNKFDEGNNVIFVNGAPEVLLERTDLDKETKQNISQELHRLSQEGKRLVGYAQKIVHADTNAVSLKDAKKDLAWMGFIAFNDPVREDVADALEKTKKAGIKLLIITGDYAQTALSIAQQLNIKVNDEDVLLGENIDKMSETALRDWLTRNSSVKLLARTKPNQKLKVVDALKANGEVVAMMGDGVNDAPALARADIGIVVGEATDVAKESADLVLLDSSFSTIVAAIEEGRGIFYNIRKVILYLLSDAFCGIIAIFFAFVFRLPLPISATQILWINIVSDGFPNLALTVDPKSPGIMENKPRDPREELLNRWMKVLVTSVSLTGGILAFIWYYIALEQTGDLTFARSIAFATLGVNTVFYVFSIKTLKVPFWKENVFNNRYLNIAVLLGLAIQMIPFFVPVLQEFFDIVNIGHYWIYAFIPGLVMFFVVEIVKQISLRTKLLDDRY